MKISAKADYACRALLELALRWPNHTPLQIQAIAKRQAIPIKFLTQILLNLKQLGVVQSIRGKEGGYALTRHPREIKLSDIIQHFEGFGNLAGSSNASTTEDDVLSGVWSDVDTKICETLDQLNFEILCDRVRSKDKAIMFDI